MKENNSDTKKPIKKIPGKKIVAKPPKFNICCSVPIQLE